MKLFRIFLSFVFTTILLFSSPNILQKVGVAKGELRLSFSKTLETKNVKIFTLSSPYRKVFDFKNTRLEDKKIVNSMYGSYRIAQYKPNVVRVVIQSEKPYSCTPYKPMLSKNQYHIPLEKGRESSFLNHTKKTKIDIVVKDIKPRLEKKKVTKVRPMTKERTFLRHSRKNDLIVIDAGHGGHDTGASCGGKKEKFLVLSIAKIVAKELKEMGYRVHLTRTKDKFLKLSQRTHIADEKGALAFISIHGNSIAKKHRHRVHGVETYFLNNTRDARSQRIAARENAAVLKGAGKLSKKVIVDSVLNGPKIVQSNKLAIDVQRRIMTNLHAKYKGVKDGGVRHAPFYVLVGASRPSILVEVGYISNPKERKRLFTSRYQNLIAKGIAEGVDSYLNNRKKEIDF